MFTGYGLKDDVQDKVIHWKNYDVNYLKANGNTATDYHLLWCSLIGRGRL